MQRHVNNGYTGLRFYFEEVVDYLCMPLIYCTDRMNKYMHSKYTTFLVKKNLNYLYCHVLMIDHQLIISSMSDLRGELLCL